MDLNSRYAYFLLCDHFADTSIVCRDASNDGKVVGFIGGYRKPDDQSTLFVWQIAVAEDYRGHKLSHRMLDRLVERDRKNPIESVEATYTPSNQPSYHFFTSFSKAREATFSIRDYLSEEDFEGHETGHEAERSIFISLEQAPKTITPNIRRVSNAHI